MLISTTVPSHPFLLSSHSQNRSKRTQVAALTYDHTFLQPFLSQLLNPSDSVVNGPIRPNDRINFLWADSSWEAASLYISHHDNSCYKNLKLRASKQHSQITSRIYLTRELNDHPHLMRSSGWHSMNVESAKYVPLEKLSQRVTNVWHLSSHTIKKEKKGTMSPRQLKLGLVNIKSRWWGKAVSYREGASHHHVLSVWFWLYLRSQRWQISELGKAPCPLPSE